MYATDALAAIAFISIFSHIAANNAGVSEPDEVAKAALFLASDDSSFVTVLNCSLTAEEPRSDRSA